MKAWYFWGLYNRFKIIFYLNIFCYWEGFNHHSGQGLIQAKIEVTKIGICDLGTPRVSNSKRIVIIFGELTFFIYLSKTNVITVQIC